MRDISDASVYEGWYCSTLLFRNTFLQLKSLHTLEILWFMSQVDGLWKLQNNPASTKKVSSLQNYEVSHYKEEEFAICCKCLTHNVVHLSVFHLG